MLSGRPDNGPDCIEKALNVILPYLKNKSLNMCKFAMHLFFVEQIKTDLGPILSTFYVKIFTYT